MSYPVKRRKRHGGAPNRTKRRSLGAPELSFNEACGAAAAILAEGLGLDTDRIQRELSLGATRIFHREDDGGYTTLSLSGVTEAELGRVLTSELRPKER